MSEAVLTRPDERRKKRLVGSFFASIGIHAAILGLLVLILRIATGPLPLLTEVTLTGGAIPKGGGSETSIKPPASVAHPATEAGAQIEERRDVTVQTQAKSPAGEKVLVKKSAQTPRKRSAEEIRAEFRKKFGGQRGVPQPNLPPSEAEELPAGSGDEGTIGLATGVNVTGDILSRGVLKQVIPRPTSKLDASYEVTLQVSVAPDGRVLDTVRVLSTVSKAELVELSINAFKQWRFVPVPAGSEQVIQSGTISFKFKPE